MAGEKQNMPEGSDQFSYWMGVVDTRMEAVDGRLAELRNIIESFISDDRRNWNRFHTWQDDVNTRLHEGNIKFADHTGRLERIEAKLFNSNSKDENNGKNNGRKLDLEKFVSWPWIRDQILAPLIVWGLIAFFAYIVVNAFVLP